MAANARSLLLILLVCVLCYARQADAAISSTAAPPTTTHYVTTSTAAPPTTTHNVTTSTAAPWTTKAIVSEKTCRDEITACSNRLADMMRTNDGHPPSSVCRVWANWETCLYEAKRHCSYADWSDIRYTAVKRYTGVPYLQRNIDENCCKPLDYCNKHEFEEATVRFEHTEKQCNATEEFWTCTRHVVITMSHQCNFSPALNSAKRLNGGAEMMLNKCYEHGYNGKSGGYFHGAAGSFQGHPLMTLVATVSAILLGVNRFQV